MNGSVKTSALSVPTFLACWQPYEPVLAASDMTELIFEKIVLMLLATFGMIAPAATATKPAIRAYSMRS